MGGRDLTESASYAKSSDKGVCQKLTRIMIGMGQTLAITMIFR